MGHQFEAFADIHFAQFESDLKATNLHIGLLLNFKAPTLVIKRVVPLSYLSSFRIVVFS